MRLNKHPLIILVGAGLLVLAGVLLFYPAQQASAQCGSQASSCKNCHEVQGKDPVNSDGTGWHQSHAFGDFCYICHAGNNQSMDQATAHTGMVAPLSDVKASCQSCHPNDLMERANVYATALGVEVGTGGSASTSSGSPDSVETSSTEAGGSAGASLAGPTGMVIAPEDVIDYNLVYAGKTPVNWGNVVLVALILMVAAGGGMYVFYNERKLRGLPFLPKRKTTIAAAIPEIPQAGQYPREVLALLPQLARLSPLGLHALRRLLENPEEASELLHSLSKLDPELVRRIRSLDREARSILMALSGGD